MHCHGIECAGSFDMGLTTAESQRPANFKLAANNIFIRTMKI